LPIKKTGGLPEGALQFQKLIKVQKEWEKLGKTIADREGKLDEKEWANTQLYLR
jgi:hypothetical protein